MRYVAFLPQDKRTFVSQCERRLFLCFNFFRRAFNFLFVTHFLQLVFRSTMKSKNLKILLTPSSKKCWKKKPSQKWQQPHLRQRNNLQSKLTSMPLLARARVSRTPGRVIRRALLLDLPCAGPKKTLSSKGPRPVPVMEANLRLPVWIFFQNLSPTHFLEAYFFPFQLFPPTFLSFEAYFMFLCRKTYFF